MLRDRPRMEAYRDAIVDCRAAIEGKVVLDVGAGTGILSVLCAQIGAKRVLAVEASAVARICQQTVNDNNVQHIVTVHQTTIEEFQLPDGLEHVDIIISEWMGFFLLHEGMLDSVVNARDRFLEPTAGLMMPATATISFAPCSVPSRFDAWNSVDGVNLSAYGRALRDQKAGKPDILTVADADLLHDGKVLAWIDLRDCTLESLATLQFKEVIVTERHGRFQGVCIWFDVDFPILTDSGDSVVLSTAPNMAPTHWKQTVLTLPEHAHETLEPRDPIALKLQLTRKETNKRQYDIELEVLDVETTQHAMPCNCIMTKCILTKAHLERVETGVREPQGACFMTIIN